MATAYYRLLATCSVLKDQLENETLARKAMELCFKKIHKSLNLYKGHLINRIRFHMNRHHTEYLRKVRVQSKKKPTPQTTAARRSERVSQLEELSAKLDAAQRQLREKEEQIDILCRMLDEANSN